ncbi:MAG: PTS glucose transporter subunit IIA [Gammaproteobacteria bacterium]|nr:PTS glucose transporter subunit IIA [Gammaproteobacteria bacterium]MBU2224790.1 PTS glucose transporter subunit IIA [Gammaproteobacteria bacterium]MBU2425256.1 PTS glucose transporter subunit IIA [Gammaproteobacteria bacterium]
MPAPFGNLHLVHSLPTQSGLLIPSPLSGLVLPIEQANEALIAAGLVGEGVLIQLQGNRLLAPFDGSCQRLDQAGQHIMLRQQNGLRLDIHFPEQCLTHHGKGFDWQIAENAKITKGQCLLQFDLALFSNWLDAPYCVVTLPQHAKFRRIWSRGCYHQALLDPLFLIELKPTESS